MNLSKVAYTLLILICTVIILIYTQELVIPFVIALIVWFLIKGIKNTLRRIPFVRKKIPGWVQGAIALLFMSGAFTLMVDTLVRNIQQLSKSLPLYESNIEQSVTKINLIFGIDLLSKMKGFTDGFDFTGMISIILNTVTAFLGDTFLILIYILFLLLEEKVFGYKLKAMYPDSKKYNTVMDLLNKIDESISGYLGLKTLVSLLTGFLSYIVLLIVGVDAPVFWALLIFIMNYIPTVGSLVGTMFPAAFALLQFGEIAPFVYVLVFVGIIQVIIGNVVEPKLLGNTLNISSLVVILSLTIWGAIWGVMGMVLSVPITVMMIIVFEQIPQLRFIAILLSEKGELKA
ncbi:MAG: AI-2 transport protein TqsA [Cyclobacteriaceae bacterium]|jgi:AI-2 transport protein TqsA